MKKYKHKRTGIIVEPGVNNNNYYYAYKEEEAIAKWVVEDSLDWEELKEPKTPVLITEDGKEMFEGEDYILFSVQPKADWYESRINLSDIIKFPKNFWLHFHTKEARQEYINKNKPKYSLEDIQKAYSAVSSTFAITYTNFIKELKKIQKNG